MRTSFFWRHFANYLLLILIPVLIASMLVHVLVVRMIEEDARKLNSMIISHFTAQADTELNGLKTNMVNLLNMPNTHSLLRSIGDSNWDNTNRLELFHSLREELNKLQAEELVSKAYLYFVHHDLVMDSEIYTDKAYYFANYSPLSKSQTDLLQANFTNKKMMSFAEAQGDELPAIMSYPFNTSEPEIYLVVNIQREKLRNLISVEQEWVSGTAIVGSEGQILSQSGLEGSELHVLPLKPIEHMAASQFVIHDAKAMMVVPSGFDDAWHYLSVVDFNRLMSPADRIRTAIWMFLIFFVLFGSIVSYVLSRRIHLPIMEIKDNLKSNQIVQGNLTAGRNEFDVIKRYSHLIVMENKQLSQLVRHVLPIVHEHFVARILQGQYQDDLSIETYAQEIGFSYNRKAVRTVLCIALHYNEAYESLSETSRSFLMAELKERIHQLIPSTLWFCQTNPDRIALVVHQDSKLHLSVQEDANYIKMALQVYGKYFKASIGIGLTVDMIEELSISYQSAVAALSHRHLHSDVEICSSGTSADTVMIDVFLSIQDVTRILNQYKAGDHGKLLQYVHDVIDEGMRSNAVVIQTKPLCSDILNTWIRAVETDRKDLNVPFYADQYQKLNRCITGDDLKACFTEIHQLLFPESETEDKSHKFNDILKYIHEHYDEELSIEYFAGTLNMSIGHFSRTFKEEVGEKYVDYIAKYRLNRAKEMLLQTDMKIDDIAAKVGYWGRNSFIRMFRRYEGITPAQYRSMHQS